jgi:hypothetical protein
MGKEKASNFCFLFLRLASDGFANPLLRWHRDPSLRSIQHDKRYVSMSHASNIRSGAEDSTAGRPQSWQFRRFRAFSQLRDEILRRYSEIAACSVDSIAGLT